MTEREIKEVTAELQRLVKAVEDVQFSLEPIRRDLIALRKRVTDWTTDGSTPSVTA